MSEGALGATSTFKGKPGVEISDEKGGCKVFCPSSTRGAPGARCGWSGKVGGLKGRALLPPPEGVPTSDEVGDGGAWAPVPAWSWKGPVGVGVSALPVS